MNGTTFPNMSGDNHGGQQYQNQNQNQYQSQQNYGSGNNGGGSGYQGNGNNGGWQGNKGSWQGNKGGGGGGWKGGGGRGGFQRPEETDMTLYKAYAVCCNQEVPPEIRQKLEDQVKHLEKLGYTLRVSGMDELDDRLEKAVTKKELILPWKGFNNKESKYTWTSERSLAIAKMFHPTFDAMKESIKKFLAKNARLIMGDKMVSPALFLITWTEDGAESVREKTNRTGFAGHPIAIASAVGIPVFNLSKPDALQRLTFLVESTNHGQTQG